HEFDAPDVDVPAGGEVVGGDGQGFQAPGVLLAAVVHLGEDGGQGHPLAGADVFEGDVQLDDPALGLQIYVPRVHHHGVGAALHGQVHRVGAALGADDHVAGPRDGGVREGHRVPLGVGVVGGLVDLFHAGGLGRVADEELQHGALAGGDPQLRDGPPQGVEARHGGGALA